MGLCGMLFAGGLKAQACETFDVASIKVNTTGLGGGYPELADGGQRFGVLSQLTGRKVLDKTGLGGRYDFILRYSPDRDGGAADEDR